MIQEDVVALLRELVQSGGTELHLKVPARPLLRVDGRLVPTRRPALDPQTVTRICTHFLGFARIEVPLASVQHRELSFGVSGLGRFHVVFYRQRGSLAASVTRIADAIASLDELGIDRGAEALVRQPGLVLICGGESRARALAALIDRYNGSDHGLVVVIEDPLTHLHRDGLATIAQRGVGTDVDSLAGGVEQARRQRADVIAVGDVPDRATAEAILRAAEGNATVLACVGAPAANLAALWILRLYDSDRDQDVKQRVQRVLRGVICLPDEGAPKLVVRATRAQQRAS